MVILEVSWDGLWTLFWALTIYWSRLLALWLMALSAYKIVFQDTGPQVSIDSDARIPEIRLTSPASPTNIELVNLSGLPQPNFVTDILPFCCDMVKGRNQEEP